ncbi:MAG: hypothetical protein ACMXX9_01975 [Candidatus Woesearchaeota archaeon]
MKKRGQVAIFALLGLVMLIVVSFMLMLVNSVSMSELQQQAQEAVQEYLESGPINYYVNLCLEQAVQESLIEMGRQGGTFFQSQQGPYAASAEGITHIPYNESTEEFNVSYGVLRLYSSPPQSHFPNVCPSIQINAPHYPLPRTPLSFFTRMNYANYCSSPTFNYTGGGFLGVNVFPRLCFNNSINTDPILIDDSPRVFVGCSGILSRSIFYDKNLSTEYLLSRRILNKTIDCINFSIFQEIDGHNVTFLENEPRDVHIIYGVEGFMTNLQLPFRVQLRGHIPVITSYNFSYYSNVRLQEIQLYLYELLRKETINPFFNILRDYNTLTIPNIGRNLFLEGFQLEIINFTDTNKAYKWDRLIKLTDTRSQIFGQNFTYYTAIQNRNPVLDYMNPSAHPELNIIVFENQTITITPFGVDPDNRPVEYSYSRWKENETNILNLTRSGCSPPLSTLDQIKSCMETQPFTGRLWTNSILFDQTKQSANYTPTIQDAGYHELRAIVKDLAGRIDFQDIKILVIDLPKANVEVSNVYNYSFDDMSIENPILIDGNKTTLPVMIPGSLDNFWWRLTRNLELIKEYTTTDLTHTLPFSYNILNIRNQIINRTGNYNMELKLTFNPGMPGVPPVEVTNSYDFEVKVCLPHRSSVPAFPYNNDTDPFLANHTCCDEDFNRISRSFVCFDEISYGTPDKLFERVQNLTEIEEQGIRDHVYDFSVTPTEIADINDLKPYQLNNVFRLDFKRNCDGSRGNICGGDITYELTSHQVCPFSENQRYQCSGLIEEFSHDELSCTNFNYTQMFDVDTRDIVEENDWFYHEDLFTGKIVDVTGISFCIKNTPAPSTRDRIGYNISDAHLLCNNAACDGEGQCRDTRFSDCTCIPERTACQDQYDATWIGEFCFYGCDTYSSCNYNFNETMPCTKDEYESNGGYCFEEVIGPSWSYGQCYVNLTEQCTPDLHYTEIFADDWCWFEEVGFAPWTEYGEELEFDPYWGDFLTVGEYWVDLNNVTCQYPDPSQRCNSVTGECNMISETKTFLENVDSWGDINIPPHLLAYPEYGDWECTVDGWSYGWW